MGEKSALEELDDLFNQPCPDCGRPSGGTQCSECMMREMQKGYKEDFLRELEDRELEDRVF